MYRAVVIGERDKILPFKALGMGLEHADSKEELERVLERVVQDPTVYLIVVSEDIVAGQPEVVSTFRERVRVPIVVIPSHLGSIGTSIAETSKVVKRAIGVDILEGGRG
ncbi:MAG: V-type ATP synthase subunit F [Candidatus Brocadiales bacterium]